MSTVITKDEAVNWLQSGALGVGEDHFDAAPREFTKNLIEQGHVRALFLECDSSAQEAFDDEVRQRRNSSSSDSSASDGRIKKIVEDAAPKYLGSGMSLGDLAVVALNKSIPVHFLDLDIPKKTTKPNPAKRDAHAAERFNQITSGTGTTGCLVHFGAVHLDRTKDVRNDYYYWDDDWLGKLVNLGIVVFVPK